MAEMPSNPIERGLNLSSSNSFEQLIQPQQASIEENSAATKVEKIERHLIEGTSEEPPTKRVKLESNEQVLEAQTKTERQKGVAPIKAESVNLDIFLIELSAHPILDFFCILLKKQKDSQLKAPMVLSAHPMPEAKKEKNRRVRTSIGTLDLQGMKKAYARAGPIAQNFLQVSANLEMVADSSMIYESILKTGKGRTLKPLVGFVQFGK